MQRALIDCLAPLPANEARVVGAARALSQVDLEDLPEGGSGAPVALCVADPVALITLLVQLDGRVDKMLLLSGALPAEQVAELRAAEGDPALVTDRADLATLPDTVTPAEAPAQFRARPRVTQWQLTTSGTTGLPKRIRHTLPSLRRTVVTKALPQRPRWGLIYDPTRFAGLQVVLQALIGGGVLLAPDTHAPITEQIDFLAKGGCSHLSATPSLWRRILMAPAHRDLGVRQVTLGGEIVDQPILDRLRAAFPDSRITHIYASTEAGVGFSVTDQREGFPAAFLDAARPGVAMRVADGLLWLRPEISGGTIAPAQPGVEVDADGFICSGDKIDIQGDRAVFLGRDSGLINVGGAKVHPETVERVLLDVPGVDLVQIVAKSNPISGALVTAQIVISEGVDPKILKAKALAHCRANLPREAVPAMLKIVSEFTTNAAGKLVRQ